jgi:hypothetical protein
MLPAHQTWMPKLVSRWKFLNKVGRLSAGSIGRRASRWVLAVGLAAKRAFEQSSIWSSSMQRGRPGRNSLGSSQDRDEALAPLASVTLASAGGGPSRSCFDKAQSVTCHQDMRQGAGSAKTVEAPPVRPPVKVRTADVLRSWPQGNYL